MGLWSNLGGLAALVGGGVLTATGVGAPLGMAIAGAGAGMLKGSSDAERTKNNKLAAAEANVYSPYTGVVRDMPEDQTNPFGDIIQGGATGLALGQGMVAGKTDGISSVVDKSKSALGSEPVPGTFASLAKAGPGVAAQQTGMSMAGSNNPLQDINQMNDFTRNNQSMMSAGSILGKDGIPVLPTSGQSLIPDSALGQSMGSSSLGRFGRLSRY